MKIETGSHVALNITLTTQAEINLFASYMNATCPAIVETFGVDTDTHKYVAQKLADRATERHVLNIFQSEDTIPESPQLKSCVCKWCEHKWEHPIGGMCPKCHRFQVPVTETKL